MLQDHQDNENVAVSSRCSDGIPKVAIPKPRAALADLGNRARASSSHVSPVKPSVKKHLTSRVLVEPNTPINEVFQSIASTSEPPARTVPECPYHSDIIQYLFELEAKFPAKAMCFSVSQDYRILRRMVINRLVAVQEFFNWSQEILFRSVAIADQFLQTEGCRDISGDLKVIIATAVFIATKYEEGRVLSDRKLTHLAIYVRAKVVDLEFKMLRALDFTLSRPTSLDFLTYYVTFIRLFYSHHFHFLHERLSNYLLELTLLEYEFYHYAPSLLAAAALCLSFKLLDYEGKSASSTWCRTLAKITGYSYTALLPLIEKLCHLLMDTDKENPYQAVRDKYADDTFENLTIIRQLQSPRKLFAQML